MKSISSTDALEKLLQGDSTIINYLYANTLPKVIYFVLKNKGERADAEEIFQDALFQIIARAKVKHFEIKSSFEAYLFTVCKNLWYQHLNKRKKEVRNDGVFELKAEEDKIVEEILFQERWELFEEMLRKLSENCMQLLKAYFSKVSYSEIVERFSYATENTAFQRVFKCKKQLTKLIQQDPRFVNLI